MVVLRVIVDATYCTLRLVEVDVVEALKTGSIDLQPPVVGNKEEFLPAHIYMRFQHRIFADKFPALDAILKRAKRRKSLPMSQIRLFIGTPVRSVSDETELGPDNLALKESRKHRLIGRKT